MRVPSQTVASHRSLTGDSLQEVVLAHPELHLALAGNLSLTETSFASLWGRSPKRDLAEVLVDRRLTPEQVDLVLRREQRRSVLTGVTRSPLSPSQALRLVRRSPDLADLAYPKVDPKERETRKELALLARGTTLVAHLLRYATEDEALLALQDPRGLPVARPEDDHLLKVVVMFPALTSLVGTSSLTLRLALATSPYLSEAEQLVLVPSDIPSWQVQSFTSVWLRLAGNPALTENVAKRIIGYLRGYSLVERELQRVLEERTEAGHLALPSVLSLPEGERIHDFLAAPHQWWRLFPLRDVLTEEEARVVLDREASWLTHPGGSAEILQTHLLTLAGREAPVYPTTPRKPDIPVSPLAGEDPSSWTISEAFSSWKTHEVAIPWLLQAIGFAPRALEVLLTLVDSFSGSLAELADLATTL